MGRGKGTGRHQAKAVKNEDKDTQAIGEARKEMKHENIAGGDTYSEPTRRKSKKSGALPVKHGIGKLKGFQHSRLIRSGRKKMINKKYYK